MVNYLLNDLIDLIFCLLYSLIQILIIHCNTLFFLAPTKAYFDFEIYHAVETIVHLES